MLIFTSAYYHEYLHGIQDNAYDTFKIEYSMAPNNSSSKDSEDHGPRDGIILSRQSCSIQNLELSRVYTDILQALEKQPFVHYLEIEDFISQLQSANTGFSFEPLLDVASSKLTLFVQWRREKRISITIRHVPIRAPDTPEDPTL